MGGITRSSIRLRVIRVTVSGNSVTLHRAVSRQHGTRSLAFIRSHFSPFFLPFFSPFFFSPFFLLLTPLPHCRTLPHTAAVGKQRDLAQLLLPVLDSLLDLVTIRAQLQVRERHYKIQFSVATQCSESIHTELWHFSPKRGGNSEA